MKFVTFEHDGKIKPGVVLDDGAFLDIGRAVSYDGDRRFVSVQSIVEAGDKGVRLLRALIEARSYKDSARVPAEKCRLLAPIPRPRKNVFCVGRNYLDHVTEGYNARGLEIKIPEHPQFFSKPPTTVIGPDTDVPFQADVMECFDYEVELAVVIGPGGRNIAPEDALDHIFGYTIVNDLTARDLQRRHDQWFKGKGLDATCPMGPWIVHSDEIADPHALSISLSVNGETRQQATTAQMIFDLRRIISDLSRGMTLEAGDIIATGTPSGVGYALDPPKFLVPGDVVRCEIEGIGVLSNRIGPADAA